MGKNKFETRGHFHNLKNIVRGYHLIHLSVCLCHPCGNDIIITSCNARQRREVKHTRLFKSVIYGTIVGTLISSGVCAVKCIQPCS